ncbi:HDOD domain-containing protein [Solimicrobium silvestre]|uniref:Putative signal transduction protein n=1 Tax=Solimicrobium silvestre TaxID=2099400 RepID=A0A2S9GZ24_9BURK|nr:HDOD domain-containing protein [Solimicrobium silvestre]PRC92957.1 putative signal transduction protein [Solimicrobium silvestre]
MNFDALFLQQHALPTIPKVVQEVIDSFNNDRVSVEDIAQKLAADQVLSAKILRLANSSYYHVSRSIGTVDDAVLMLGFMTVRTLVVSTGLTNGFKNVSGFDLKKFWRYSMHTAVIAKWLSKQKKTNSDFAFTVGMMHAIGQLVMHAAMPEEMMEVDKIAGALDARRFDIESKSFGYNFADVGAELAVRWKFPDEFGTAIRCFPHPLEHDNFDPMAGIIHLAAWRSRAFEHDLTAEEMQATFPTEVAAKLNIRIDMILTDMPGISELSEGLESLVG